MEPTSLWPKAKSLRRDMELQPTEVKGTLINPPQDTGADPVKVKGEVGVNDDVKDKVPHEKELNSSIIAAIAKKEKKNLDEKRRLKREREALEANSKDRESAVKDAVRQELRNLAKGDPTKLLNELGTSYQAITDHILSDGKATPDSVAQYVKQLEKDFSTKLDEKEKSFNQRLEELQTRENNRVMQIWRDNIKKTVQLNKDKFEYVNEIGDIEVVEQIIEQDFLAKIELHGEDEARKMTLSAEDAAERYEKYLETQEDKISKTKKFQSRFSRLEAKKQIENEKQSLDKPKTITNQLTSTAPSLLPSATEEDRIRRALEKLQGQ